MVRVTAVGSIPAWAGKPEELKFGRMQSRIAGSIPAWAGKPGQRRHGDSGR